jgi:arylsulfatase
VSFNQYFSSLRRAGFSGLITGILIGVSLAVTLLVFSPSFLEQTGRTLFIIAYVTAYSALLFAFLFSAAQAVIYFFGKPLREFVPAAFPGTLFFFNAVMLLLFYVYDGIMNLTVKALVVSALVAAFLISVVLRKQTARLLHYLEKHRKAVFILFLLCVFCVVVFRVTLPSVPYPGYDAYRSANAAKPPVKRQSKNLPHREQDETEESGISDPPNVVLVTIETLRAGHVGAYGYRRDITPHIDRFAAENVLFRTCYVQSPATVVNLSSLLTSAYPGETGVYAQNQILPPENLTIAERLQKEGYHTIGVVCNYLLPEEKGLGIGRGFDVYVNLKNSRGEAVTEDAVSRLKDVSRPFFLWVHYFDPHAPYTPPDKLLHTVGDMPQPAGADKTFPLVDYGSTAGVNLGRTFGGHIDTLELAQDREVSKADIYDRYDAEIRYADSQVGRLLAFLEQRDLYENSLVIITSDHGESLVEHRLYCQHCLDLFRGNTEVPLLVKFPAGGNDSRSEDTGVKVETPVSTIDIVPTILDVLDVPGTAKMSGTSLVRFLNPSAKPRRKYHVLMTGWWGGLSIKLRNVNRRHPDFAIVADPYKYILHSVEACNVVYPTDLVHLWRQALRGQLKGDGLYNLETDPRETANIIKDNPKTAEMLKRKLFDSSEFRSYIRRRYGNVKKEKLSEDQVKKLKSLGYL